MKIGDVFLYLFVFVVGLRVVKSRDVVCFFDEQVMGKQVIPQGETMRLSRAVLSRARASVCSSRLGRTRGCTSGSWLLQRQHRQRHLAFPGVSS